jgi:two-component system sensor histidine kinase CpxA
MKVRFPLYLQILGFLLLHLALLLTIFVMFFNTEFGPGLHTLIEGPVGDQMDALAWNIRRQTQYLPASSWNATLAEFGKMYGVKFYIFDGNGQQLAGEPITLPVRVRDRIVLHPPMPPMAYFGSQRGPNGNNSMPPSLPPAMPGHRFLMHTRDPGCFWIGTVYPVPTPSKLMPVDSLRAATAFRPGRPLRFGILIASTPNLWQSKLFLDIGFVLAMTGAALGISIVIWLPFAISLTRRIGELRSATQTIAEGNFNVHLKGGNLDEINSLASTVNTLSVRLGNYVLGQRRFLGDIAHELCSPIARLQLALAVLEDSDNGKHTQVIADIKEEVEDMSTLIQELLSFSKASIVGSEVQSAPVALAELLRETVAKVGAESIAKLSVADDLIVQAEPTMLKRAVSNVVRNSFRYAGTYGPIEITAKADDKFVDLVIADHGPGVPPDALRYLGEPFYRPEPSRDRTSGGVGLGLAIVKTCIETCNGVFSVENRSPRGLIVRLRIPRASADVALIPVSAEPAIQDVST